MPELPDIAIYLEALEARISGEVLGGVRVASPHLVKTFDPRLSETEGKRVTSLGRLGKRVVIGLEDDLYIVLHLMIAGRLHWRDPGAKLGGKQNLAAFDFDGGTLTLTEAGAKRRTSLHVFRGADALADHDPGGIDVFDIDLEEFAARLRETNHTVKRALTDPRILSGIGNAYSDEILHRARLSPVTMTQKMTDDEAARLFEATRTALTDWTDRLRAHYGDKFPEKVTAFRDGMAVHGRYKEPCPDCGAPVQRIVHGNHETNYCPACQTGGKLLADRSLSRLLGKDWPKSLEELEVLQERHRG